jgi:putative membrane protein
MGRQSYLNDLREHRVLVVFVGCYVVAIATYGFSVGSGPTAVYVPMMALIIGAAAVANHRVRFSTPLLWALAAWGLVHMAGGVIPVGNGTLYNVRLGIPYVHYDRVVHMFGFGFATIACWQALHRHLPARVEVTGGLALIVGLMGMGVGAFNEVVEFTAGNLFTTNVGGYRNTGFDLVSNTIGCTLAALWVRRRGLRQTGVVAGS